MREDGLLDADRHPLLTHLVVFRAGETGQVIEPAPHPLESVPAHVVAQELAADSMLTGLARREVAMLLVGGPLEPLHVRLVMHKQSIALLMRTYSDGLVTNHDGSAHAALA